MCGSFYATMVDAELVAGGLGGTGMGGGEDGCGGCVEVVRMMGGHKCSLDTGMSGLVFKTAGTFAYN